MKRNDTTRPGEAPRKGRPPSIPTHQDRALLCLLLARLSPWARSWVFLCFGFFICDMETVSVSAFLSECLTWASSQRVWKHLHSCHLSVSYYSSFTQKYMSASTPKPGASTPARHTAGDPRGLQPGTRETQHCPTPLLAPARSLP